MAPAGGSPLDFLRDLRNRLVADGRFRRLAARFILTRPTSRRATRELFDLAAGFVYSQTLAAFVRLGLHDFLAGQPRSTAEIAARCGLHPDRAERLMLATAALGLTEPRSGGRHALGRLGAALVGNDGVLAMIAHHDMLYRDLADPVALLRGRGPTALSRFWTYAQDGTGDGPSDDYSRLMAASQDFIANEVLDAVNVSRHRRLMDIGGGTGSFLLAAALRAPRLELVLFDLPQVVELATARPEIRALSDRLSVRGGSFLDGALPAGADIITLNRVLHDHEDDAARAILHAAYAAVARGGRLVVAEPMAGTPGAERSGDAYFGLYLTAMRQGRPRRFEEIAAMVREAGFEHVREARTATPLIVRVLVARA